MEERAVADVVCPVCGLPLEVAQSFVRPSDDREYVTVRCLSDHYITMLATELDALIVGDPATAEIVDGVEEGLD